MIFKATQENFTLKQRIRFFRKAKTIHDVDSPFVYQFCKYIVEDDRNFYLFPLGRLLYQEAKQAEKKRISTPPLMGKRLFRAVEHYKPEFAVELGSGDGLSTIYQAAAMLTGDLFSLDESSTSVTYAQNLVEEIGLPNIKIIQKKWSGSLSALPSKKQPIDQLFFSPQCPAEVILSLFQVLNQLIHNESVLIMANLYQSIERREVWEALKQSDRVRLSIDLFNLGFLFFNPSFHKKQDYYIVPAKQKPWRLGVFR